MRINEIIREKRREQGLTQEQAAHRLGVTASAVNKWERGVSQTLRHAARAYGLYIKSAIQVLPGRLTFYSFPAVRLLQRPQICLKNGCLTISG